MKVKLVSIGNSKGIRLPAVLIKEYGLEEEVEIEAQKDGIFIRSSIRTREGWEAAFERMHATKDDVLLDANTELSQEWDDKEWTW